MFAVIPPPPRTTVNGGLYPGLTSALETHNILTHPTGLDLVVGEGTYVLKDDLQLATPPPHPNDVAPSNTNPLAPNTGPPTIGTKVSIVTFASSTEPVRGLFHHSSRSQIASIQEEVSSPKSDSGSITNGFGSSNYYNALPSYGENNAALAQVVVKGKKKEDKSKPKNNMVKSNSSFVSRVVSHDSMSKRLNERSPEGLMAFANVNRAYYMLDLSAENKSEQLSKVLFTKAHVLCHDVNQLTKTTSHVDVVMGFNTGDIIWYEPISQKYARINKNGCINATPVIDINWLPRKEGLFLATHQDGTSIVYDKEKEDADFVPEAPLEAATEQVDNSRLQMLKSVQSQNQKSNPIAAWRVSKARINKCAFSPDGQHLALVSDDGTLTVFDYINEHIVDVYRSFYGALLSVAWSPDGQYVLTGGQDDLVSIWSFAEQALVARCIGHESWVRDLKFDPWRCDERNYRFGSVGEDCRLLLWDFSVGMLGRPKAMSLRNRGSISSGPGQARKESIASNAGRLRSNSNLTQIPDEQGDVVHAVEAKAAVATLPPVMSKAIGERPLRWLDFTEKTILASDDGAHIREWDRPSDAAGDGPGGSRSASITGLRS
ncbi:hypothetical protein AMS68_006955 [Peltaster fructicola]|uniref:Uncharacterized protein n=1 Tax=Peltaster fructicola TaxID=286661 RepID=A0A6H0Y3L5_9PEZI|nr:hypothetical protein AMS68_006955 [Peltaster fructicola]